MERKNIGWSDQFWDKTEEDFLFDSSILYQLDCTNFTSYTDHGISIQSPGNGLMLRSLRRSDYSRSYIDLLSQLTTTGNITQKRFEEQFDAMKKSPGIHYVMVIEDIATSKVIGTISMVIERKFTHDAALRGRLEDLVVDRDHRGKHLGHLLIETASCLGNHLGCYKISLDCKPPLIPFYGKFQFEHTPVVFLVRRFFD